MLTDYYYFYVMEVFRILRAKNLNLRARLIEILMSEQPINSRLTTAVIAEH